MRDRTLEALGLGEAPREHPLSYPGVWPVGSGLLDGDRLLPLERLTHPDRVPVLAVGSNASPGQLRHKMAAARVTSPVPMTRAGVTGLEVGVSAHVSVMGYMSASPFRSPGTVRELFVTWFDAAQLALVDASEGVPLPDGHYLRVWLPASEVRIELADGTVLPGAFGYVNRRGVLLDRSGSPRVHLRDQRALLTGLLADSPGLRRLFGDTAREFSRRARADPELCAAGTLLFAAEGMVTASGLEGLARALPARRR
ncbi:hypothetical protein ABZ439_04040 [Streptomyces sp. NPDC005840]|uniref:hypothetical protein n=1 Tax=Streptomyces sp. NPDC005840 TaxID=3157072 RepID=UPI0033FAC536